MSANYNNTFVALENDNHYGPDFLTIYGEGDMACDLS